MAFVIFICRRVSGTMRRRVAMVKTMMLRPKLLKKTQYRNTRLLIIGLLMIRSQRSPISSKIPPLPVYFHTVRPAWISTCRPLRKKSSLAGPRPITSDRVVLIGAVYPYLIGIAVRVDFQRTDAPVVGPEEEEVSLGR